MQLLVITDETQGQRKNDFCFAEVGELATFGSTCDGGRVDDNCGCSHSMCGLKSKKASTTVKVVEMPIDLEEFTLRLAESMKRAWPMFSTKEVLDMVNEDAAELTRIAKMFRPNSVLEIRGAQIKTRR